MNWADFPSVVPIDATLWAAHWLKKSAALPYAYDVLISVSQDAGRTWSAPRMPHTDGTPTEHGFVSLFPAEGGVGALWLDGRKMVNEFDAADPGASGMTFRSAVVTTSGTLSDEALIDELVCECCQTDVALASEGPVAVYRNRTEAEVRDIYLTRHSRGRWQTGVRVAEDGWRIAGCPVNGPAIAARGDHVAVAWFSAANDAPKVRIAFSTDGGASFGNAIDVDDRGTLGRVDLLMLDDNNAVLSSLHDGGNGVAQVRLVRVDANGTRGKSITVAATSAGRLSGFPRIARRDEAIVVAWNDADTTSTQVRTALVPITLL